MATSLSKNKILIANRGEIAIRVARTAKRLGLSTVMVYSDEDENSEHILYGDEAYRLPGRASAETYLNIPKLLQVIRLSGATHVHPGYGFLSERAEFADALSKNKIGFMGPSADSMRVMGDKIAARQTVDALGVPRVPGSPGVLKTIEDVKSYASKIPFPILLKAAAGGGGKGMRRVDRMEDLARAFEGASGEAKKSFGDESLYLERYILKPHHVEVQVFGDGKGGAVHLWDRECSIQRRHQKVWEESPAPHMQRFPKSLEKMLECSVRVAQSIKYAGAGTFEYVVDEEGNFYFLEMNTRLQVEHPVTEWVTGVDLVEWQIRLVTDPTFKLPSQSTIDRRGAAIEVRIYAEDPETFLPAPGAIGSLRLASGPFVRVDSAFHEKGRVSMLYDPMISKVSTWGLDRESALGRLSVALSEMWVTSDQDGLKTNVDFLQRLCKLPDVIEGTTSTDLIEATKEVWSNAQDRLNKDEKSLRSQGVLVRHQLREFEK